MDPWPFVIAAYGLTFVGTLALSIWTWEGMKRAEKRAEDMKREQ